MTSTHTNNTNNTNTDKTSAMSTNNAMSVDNPASIMGDVEKKVLQILQKLRDIQRLEDLHAVEQNLEKVQVPDKTTVAMVEKINDLRKQVQQLQDQITVVLHEKTNDLRPNDLREQVNTILLGKIKHQIRCDLTVGMEDNDKEPWSDVAIGRFLQKHQARIQKVVDEMIDAFDVDGVLADLLEPDNTWIREFLYDFFPEIPNYME